MVKNPPANARDIREADMISGWEDLLEEGMTTHSSILAWRIPWIEEPGLQSMGAQSAHTQRERLCIAHRPRNPITSAHISLART